MEMLFLEISQARPVLQNSLMQRMTDVLSRMLNDPATRAALNGGGELSNSIEGVIEQHAAATHSHPETGPGTESPNLEMEIEDRRPSNTEQDQGANLFHFYQLICCLFSCCNDGFNDYFQLCLGDSHISNMPVEDIESHEESNRENHETNDQISDETINQENVPMETESSHEFSRDRFSKKYVQAFGLILFIYETTKLLTF